MRTRIDAPARAHTDVTHVTDASTHHAFRLDSPRVSPCCAQYWPTSHPLRGEPVACALHVSADGTSTRLLPAVTDFYWRRDMSSGVKWARSLSSACEVKQWSGWSDAKGNVSALQGVAARGAVAVNASMPAVERDVSAVASALAVQLETTFLGAEMARRLHSRGGKLVLRARVVEADGEAYRVRNVWECPLQIG